MTNRVLYKVKIFTYRLTGFIRPLPDFIIIGVPRAGTTSLYNYLTEHPSILPSLWKEVTFFSGNYNKGVTWYRSHFPLKLINKIINPKEKFLTGEATPNYLYHPLVPKRIYKLIPNVKMILLLKNPVDRANSHYWQAVRKNCETLSFEEVIKKQMSIEPLSDEELFFSKGTGIAHQYISGGIYINRIKRYFEIFPHEQILILKSEDLYENPTKIMKIVYEFLNIPSWELKSLIKYNYHEDQKRMDNSLRKELVEYFKPHNEKLYKYLNKNFYWDS